ncbi:unnamed protein product [Chilo suppressalis]|uniref:Glycolipid transfer protein domain-containing protein n=1 Tax=Chilo suppressalis TaxID=168631 RepID=A0ABN8EBF1_CHISP|nr:hypothetical protein evm_000629 [Chilo suppressalis]CAH0692454.1 unnamed protein product [Chilo suppressalis]
MASTSNTDTPFFHNLKEFPPIIDGRINLTNFLAAANDLVLLVERLGKLFAPVKYDMQGNIDKIAKFFEFDETSCLLEVMLDEVNSGKCTGTEGVLWLNRAILFFEIIFQEILKCLQANEQDINMTKIYIIAYEESVKKYHNWITQQLFALICKMSPTYSQIMKSLEVDKDVRGFELRLTSFNNKLHLVRYKIDDCFKEHNLFQ